MSIFKKYFILTILFAVLAGFSTRAWGEVNEVISSNHIEISSEEQQELWKQPDFVKAYFVVAEPGGALYSIFGHACLHLVCPAYELDYFFSYESENVASRFFKFLSGNLKMGMIGMTEEDYLSDYAADGRGVKEYELNLPIDVKRNLWRVIDEKIGEGMDLPYDYSARGCAQACVTIVEEALGDKKIEYGTWSLRFERTRREIANDFAHFEYPWNFLVITSVVGAEYDKVDTITEKLLIPTEVVEVWQNAKVDGEYLLSREAHEILPSKAQHSTQWFTPTLLALLLLLLAIIALFLERPWIDWLILAIVTVVGVMETYLVVFSTLPCTNWHWLIVPFNVLPAICWKWRNYWALPYAAIIGVWAICMISYPHQLVDESMIVLAVAFMMILLNKRNRYYRLDQ